ncbi:MAG: redoxin family protein [Luteitalea sp.]|nr:redoxin family protein [Luteitalea sp.]
MMQTLKGMMQTHKGRRPARILLAALLVAVVRLPDSAHAAERFKAFKLKSADGRETKLADVLDRATVVVFFFPTCGFCKASLPSVQKLHDAYKDQGLSMVWINVVPNEDRLIADWRAKNGFSVPVLLGGRSAQNDYKLTMTPTNYLLDVNGTVVFKQTGFTDGDEKELERQIRQALALTP